MTLKKRAPTASYISPSQLGIDGFDSPFTKSLDPTNRWVVLSGKVPWDKLVSIYNKQMKNDKGRPGLNARVVLGSMIIKHICNLSDRDTVEFIRENVYMQYFLGYTGFRTSAPFDASLFVEIRLRLGLEGVGAMNEAIAEMAGLVNENEHQTKENENPPAHEASSSKKTIIEPPKENNGRLLMDATACPQDIAYPTDLGLLNDAREKSEQLIDLLYNPDLHGKRPRTYRKIARKLFLCVAQKKIKHKTAVHKGIGQQLRYLRRNLSHIHTLLDSYPVIPLARREHKYLLVIACLYQQQEKMHREHTHSVADRIVSIHQPHVRPIVRGKSRIHTEFGSKINVSLVDGYAFLDELSWDAFNEGSHMKGYIEQYRNRFGCFPKEVLADKIYCNRENRKYLQEHSIRLLAKPLGRPPAVTQIHVRPGERNPIEGKFGQAKNGYGMERIRARLQQTSQTWVAMILLVVNLVKLAGKAPHYLYLEIYLRFSAMTKSISLKKEKLTSHIGVNFSHSLSFSADPT